MTFNFFKTFSQKADNETAKLTEASNPKIRDMANLVVGAIQSDIPTFSKMTDDSDTAVSAAVTAQLFIDPQDLARIAEASFDLGR